VKIVEALKADEVIFGPDANLAMYVQNKTGKKVIPIPERGFCQTHVLFLREDILLLKERFPNATVMVHPECTPQVHEVADFVGSTSQMCDLARRASSSRFIVGTEVGLLHRLRRENPGKVFIPAYEDAMCVNMKLNTLERVLHALKEEQHVVTVPKPVARRAYASIKRMFDLTAT
jgi:quinolinate synthase